MAFALFVFSSSDVVLIMSTQIDSIADAIAFFNVLALSMIFVVLSFVFCFIALDFLC